ncbi:MAG TPA: DUF6599 family protein [Bryobacteraceae bacterium]|nr:DUF6599 family protein [Bryobacteraceae bacterium]
MSHGTLAAALLAAAALAPAQPVPDCKVVPGWEQKGPARAYTADDLFEYMDGNAEGYLIYGFRKMNGLTCAKGEVEFLMDISEMVDADSAYGIFTANRDPKRPVESIGMAAQIQPRRATVVKDRYYVEVAANQEGDHTAELKAFATALEKRISGRTTLPDAISWFPREKQQSLRMVPESVLGLRLLKRGYMGQYDYGKAFLVRETSPEAAAAVMEKLRARFGNTHPAQVGDEAFQLSEKYLGRMCFFRKGQYLGGWANVAEGQDPLALAAALSSKVK